MTTKFVAPSFSEAISTNLTHCEQADQVRENKAASSGLSAEAVAILDCISRTTQEIDQASTALGLGQIQSELLCSKSLRGKTELFFEKEIAELKDLTDEYDSLPAVKETGSSHEHLSSHNPMAQDFDFDLDWEQLASLPQLELEKGHNDLATQKFEFLFSRYEALIEKLGSIHTNYSKKIHSHLSKAEVQQMAFVKKLSELIGYKKDIQFSTKYKYFHTQAIAQKMNLLSYNGVYKHQETDEHAEGDLLVNNRNKFALMKSLVTESSVELDRALKLETVEAYIRMQLFFEYSRYIDLYYRKERKSDPSRLELQRDIALGLSVHEYFDLGSSKEGPISHEELKHFIEEPKYRNLVRSFIQDDDLRDFLDEEAVNFMTICHKNKVIYEQIGRKESYQKEARFKRFTNMDDVNASFRVNKKDINLINNDLHIFVHQLAVDKEKLREEDFSSGIVSFPDLDHPLINQSVRLKKVQNKLTNGFPNYKCSQATIGVLASAKHLPESAPPKMTDFVKTMNSQSLWPEIDGMMMSSYLAEGLLNSYQFEKSKIEPFLQQAFEKSGDGIESNSIEGQLKLVADELLTARDRLETSYIFKSNYVSNLLNDIKCNQATRSADIREYFRLSFMKNLRQKHLAIESEIDEELNNLLSAKDEAGINQAKEKIAELRKKINDSNEQANFLANCLCKLYQLIYDPNCEGSLARLISNLEQKLQNGVISPDEMIEVEQAFDTVKGALEKLSPSLCAKLAMQVQALKTQVAYASVCALEEEDEKLMKNRSVLLDLKNDYERKRKRYRESKTLSSADERVKERAFNNFNRRHQECLTQARDIQTQVNLCSNRVESLRPVAEVPMDPRFLSSEQINQLRKMNSPFADRGVNLANVQGSAISHLRAFFAGQSGSLESFDASQGMEARLNQAITDLKNLQLADLSSGLDEILIPSILKPSECFQEAGSEKIASFVIGAFRKMCLYFSQRLMTTSEKDQERVIARISNEQMKKEKELQVLQEQMKQIARKLRFNDNEVRNELIQLRTKVNLFVDFEKEQSKRIEKAMRVMQVYTDTLENSDILLSSSQRDEIYQQIDLLNDELVDLTSSVQDALSEISANARRLDLDFERSTAVKSIMISKSILSQIDLALAPSNVTSEDYTQALEKVEQSINQKEKLKEIWGDLLIEVDLPNSLLKENLSELLVERQTARFRRIARLSLLCALQLAGLEISKEDLQVLIDHFQQTSKKKKGLR